MVSEGLYILNRMLMTMINNIRLNIMVVSTRQFIMMGISKMVGVMVKEQLYMRADLKMLENSMENGKREKLCLMA